MKRPGMILLLALLLLLCAACGSTPAAPAEAVSSEAVPAEAVPAEAAPAETTAEPATEPAPEVLPVEATAEPAPESIPESAPEPATEPATEPAPEPVPEPAAEAILHVYGDGVSAERWFTLAELQGLGDGYVEAEYYYRGKDPDRGHSLCQGVSLAYLLDSAVGLDPAAAKAVLRAGDGYAMSYTLANVRKAYVDETDAAKQLSMILAWMVDGESRADLTLVMGQNLAGEYNRTVWVKAVVEIEVSR